MSDSMTITIAVIHTSLEAGVALEAVRVAMHWGLVSDGNRAHSSTCGKLVHVEWLCHSLVHHLAVAADIISVEAFLSEFSCSIELRLVLLGEVALGVVHRVRSRIRNDLHISVRSLFTDRSMHHLLL